MLDLTPIKERLEKATGNGERPLPWRVWTSCSFRRVGCDATGGDGDVLSAYNQRSDNHPDLTMPEDRLVALIDVVNSAPALIERVEELEGALEEVADPLTALKRRAAKAGRQLSGEAYGVVNTLHHVQSVARSALGRAG